MGSFNTFDNKQCEYFINKYKDIGYTIALRIVKNSLDAEEIVQDSFIKVFQKFNRFRGESKFSTWFYKVVYNTALSHLRSQNSNKAIQINEYDSMVETSGNQNEAIENLNERDKSILVNKVLESLNEQDYTIIVLYYYESKTLREISEITGIKRNYLKVIIQRARSKVKQSFSKKVKKELEYLVES